MKTALICGVSGQDGAYLARLLLEKGYKVYGTSRDAQISDFENLEYLGVREDVETLSMAPSDFRSVLQTLTNVMPHEVYNLSGQSSVGLSFQQPVEALESIAVGTINLLESIRFLGEPIRFYNAGSGECFGNTSGVLSTEATPFSPRSPYAVAKSAAFWEVANYREAYELFAVSGILFNHESPLRQSRFVTRKIVQGAIRISRKEASELSLGNLSIVRDWGWASEFVEAMWLMLQEEDPQDFVVSTGVTYSLEEFCQHTFQLLGMNWKDHVKQSESMLRPSDLDFSGGDPSHASLRLGWHATLKMPEVIEKMLEAEIARTN